MLTSYTLHFDNGNWKAVAKIDRTVVTVKYNHRPTENQIVGDLYSRYEHLRKGW